MSNRLKVAWSLTLAFGFLFATVAVLTSCAPGGVQVSASPAHPNADTVLVFTATWIQQATAVEILVNNVRIGQCAGTPCVQSAGPFPAYAGSKIRYEARARDTNNNWVQSGMYALPIVGCFDDPDFTPPSQIPNSTATQTGPNLYQLSDPIVREKAMEALQEYANSLGINVAQIDTADEYVEAIASYVDQHMSWTSDGTHNPDCINAVNQLNYSPGWDFPIPANYTLRYTGVVTCGCPNDYCGDCEDHAILRSALLRSLGFSPHCIWDAIDDPVTHEYNIVNYRGAYRIMDYGVMATYIYTSGHQTYYAWNEDYGPRNAANINHTYAVSYTWNFPRGDYHCRASDWSRDTYYGATCP